MTDKQLRALFEQRDRRERELRMLDARIASARPAYAQRHGFRAFPSIDAMRKAVCDGR